jgi:hypothetical protein
MPTRACIDDPMTFNPETGELLICEGACLHRGVVRADLAATPCEWEVWREYEGEVICYRAVFSSTKSANRRIIVVTFESNNGPVSSWTLLPAEGFEGVQSRSEGKHTKHARAWFLSSFRVKLPLRASWGEIDATYDPHNSVAYVYCEYR